MKFFKEYLLPRLIIDIVPFYLLLMVIGWVASGLPFDGKLLLGMAANYLMLAFAFVINDIEDRKEDEGTQYRSSEIAHRILSIFGADKDRPAANSNISFKRFRNPFASKQLTPIQGYFILVIVIILSLWLSFLAGGWPVVKIATTNLIVGILYSWKVVRLKSIMVIDILSHAYLLATVQILYFLFYPGAGYDNWGVLLIIAVTAGSIAGDLINEYRDFKVDQDAGIKNTATLIGEQPTKWLSYILYAVAAIMVGIAAVGIVSTRLV